MRPELIVFVTKAIEPSLLLIEVGGRRTRRLGFQDTMHPLVLPVLLWLARFNCTRIESVVESILKKKGFQKGSRNLLILLIGARGFEPPTSRSQTERSTKLSHAPIGW
jgi:hypothetical protein